MKPRILIVDDEAAVRNSLSSVLATYGFKTTSCGNANDALRIIRKSVTDCVLVDVRMPEIDGLALQRMLTEVAPDLPVIMITGHGDIAMAVRAMKNGAFDFVEKPINDEEMAGSINAAITARKHPSNVISDNLVLAERYNLLTTREKSIARMVSEGYSTASIAATLFISARTVDHHRASILAKMQATSLPQLIRLLLQIS